MAQAFPADAWAFLLPAGITKEIDMSYVSERWKQRYAYRELIGEYRRLQTIEGSYSMMVGFGMQPSQEQQERFRELVRRRGELERAYAWLLEI